MPYTTEYDLVSFDARSAIMYVRVRTLDGVTVIDTRESVPVRLPVDASGLVPEGAVLTEIISSAVARSFSTEALAETERLARITDAGGTVINAATIWALTEEIEPESVVPVSGYGVLSLGKPPEGVSGSLGQTVYTLTPSMLVPEATITAGWGWQYTDPAGPGGSIVVDNTGFTIVGTTLTITAPLGIDFGRDPVGFAGVSATFAYGIGNTLTLDTPISVNDETVVAHVVLPYSDPYDELTLTPATFSYNYDVSGNIDRITLLTTGTGYPFAAGDVPEYLNQGYLLFYRRFNPSTVLAISSTIDFNYEDELSIWGRIGGLNVIGQFYDGRNNTDPAEGGNGGPYSWGAADDTPITATWTDGSRSISLTYQRTNASITASPPPYSSNLNYWYSFIVIDPILDFTVTGDWTSADFIPVVGVNPPEQDPRIIFEIDYDNPTVINLVTPPSTGVRSGADQHHLQIELYNDGSAYYVDPSETLFVRIGGIT
jgi:hypothetical protein